MFSRRHFVVATGVGVLAGGFGVGQILNAQRTAPAAAGPATGTAAPAAEPAGMAGMPGMPAVSGPSTTSTFSYRGHSVKLTESTSAAALTIDGRSPIHLSRPEAGKLYTHLLPFTMYEDRNALVRDVVECTRLGLFVI